MALSWELLDVGVARALGIVVCSWSYCGTLSSGWKVMMFCAKGSEDS